MFGQRIAHGMLSAAFISNVLGTQLPGPGTIYMGQELRFLKPVYMGDTVTATVTVTQKIPEKNRLILDTVVTNQRGEKVITGARHSYASQALIPPLFLLIGNAAPPKYAVSAGSGISVSVLSTFQNMYSLFC